MLLHNPVESMFVSVFYGNNVYKNIWEWQILTQVLIYVAKAFPIFMEKVASFQKMFVPLFWTFLLTNLQQSLDELRPYTVKQLSIIIQPTGELNIL